MNAWMRNILIRSGRFFDGFRILIKPLWIVVISFLLLTLTGCKEHFIGILNPKGIIAYEERKLLFDTLALMLIVVLPVIIMSFTFVYHYQVSHRIRDYKPNWSHSYLLELLWWCIPCTIIFILAILTWRSTHELDPYQKIPGHNQRPLLIEVIALPWKWLFIYPEQGIATVNFLVVPVGVQVEYWFTTDNVPMSAFFIPQLGSQIYVMGGMRTRLHLLANEVGVYDGMNTQYNGTGFSDMHFPVHVIEPEKMQLWVNEIKKSSNQLTEAAYKELLIPSTNEGPKFFASIPPNLFQNVIATYMHTFGTVHPRSSMTKIEHGV